MCRHASRVTCAARHAMIWSHLRLCGSRLCSGSGCSGSGGRGRRLTRCTGGLRRIGSTLRGAVHSCCIAAVPRSQGCAGQRPAASLFHALRTPHQDVFNKRPKTLRLQTVLSARVSGVRMLPSQPLSAWVLLLHWRHLRLFTWPELRDAAAAACARCISSTGSAAAAVDAPLAPLLPAAGGGACCCGGGCDFEWGAVAAGWAAGAGLATGSAAKP